MKKMCERDFLKAHFLSQEPFMKTFYVLKTFTRFRNLDPINYSKSIDLDRSYRLPIGICIVHSCNIKLLAPRSVHISSRFLDVEI